VAAMASGNNVKAKLPLADRCRSIVLPSRGTRMNEAELLVGLVGGIYDAALNPVLWSGPSARSHASSAAPRPRSAAPRSSDYYPTCFRVPR